MDDVSAGPARPPRRPRRLHPGPGWIFGATWAAIVAGLIIAALRLLMLAARGSSAGPPRSRSPTGASSSSAASSAATPSRCSVEKVESVDVNQSLLGRILDYGDVTVRGTGAGLAPLNEIDSPLDFRSHVKILAAHLPPKRPTRPARRTHDRNRTRP